MRKYTIFLCILIMVLLVSCGKAAKTDTEKTTLAKYSNLVDSDAQNELKNDLLSIGVSEKVAETFISDVNDYNETIHNTTLIKSGYKPFDLSPIDYDDDTISDLWNQKYPRFMGYNCKLTAYYLYRDFLQITPIADESQTEMNMLFDLAPEKADGRLSEYDIQRFNTLYQTVDIKSDSTVQECVEKIKDVWKNSKISFGASENSALITVYAEEDESDILEPVHAGLLISTGDSVRFLEKLSFMRPYQYSVFGSEEDLYTYLKNMFGRDKKIFVIMKNAESLN